MKTSTVTVIGKTMAVISLNKIGGYVRGTTPAVLVIDSEEKQAEINGLVRAGLISIECSSLPKNVEEPSLTLTNDTASSKIDTEVKGKVGRPKGSKSKIKKASSEQLPEQPVKSSTSETPRSEEMGGRVVVGTGSGNKEGRMRTSAIDDVPESEATRASIEAMKKLEEEERTGKSRVETIIDESKLDAADQMGRKAVVSNEGEAKKEAMENSVLPYSKTIKDRDPFIDEKSQEEIDRINEAFIDAKNTEESELEDDDFLKL